MPLNQDAMGTTTKPTETSWTSKDSLLYALGVGAGATDPTGFELEFTTENSDGIEQKALPTMPVVLGGGGSGGAMSAVGTFDWAMLVHGEQGVTLHQPVPVAGTALMTGKVAAMYDKGKAAVVVLEGEARTPGGELLWTTTMSAFIRGEGGWGGDRGPSGPRNVPPERAPDEVVSYSTRTDQALLYRLCGDRNPLHADPDFAKAAGFPAPILHGLCSYGIVLRELTDAFLGGDATAVTEFGAKFTGVVFPGETIRVRGLDDLLGAIPADARGVPMGVPSGLTEAEVTAHLGAIAALDRPAGSGPFFLGGPVQRRYIPAAVPALALRGEFLTAYTPYQPEVSQGTLQAIWEFQSLICELFALDVANASMYEGGTALAEAAFMAVRATGRKRVVVARETFYQFRDTLRTYAQGPDLEIVEVPTAELAAHAADAACLVVQHPDVAGGLVDVRAIADAAHAAGALCVQVTEPHACAVLQPPGALGVDIAVAEGQPLGIPMSFGGPYLGLLACREALVRQMPGRIVGRTQDARGTRGFVNTLQTREQHIRREKATSNICTNEAIAAITAAIYIALLGPQGLRAAAARGAEQAHALAARLARLDGCSVAFDRPFLDRFPLRTPLGPGLVDVLVADGIQAGRGPRDDDALGGATLFQCTELTTDDDLDAAVAGVERALAGSRQAVRA